MSLYVGEALTGEGNEVAHIDLLIGDKGGPVGVAFANALARQSEGHSNLLAVLEPNLAVKPATVMISKVTIKGAGQAVQIFGPAQKGVAKAVADSRGRGHHSSGPKADELVIVCGVFIHWLAEDNAKIEQYNYEATKLSIERAMANQPSAAEVIEKKDTADHPFPGLESGRWRRRRRRRRRVDSLRLCLEMVSCRPVLSLRGNRAALSVCRGRVDEVHSGAVGHRSTAECL
ncbi:MAG: hypothetical protein CM1200mP2_29760 [Planctomycetaceae bacterium]|nr:MAG: hypothetical protein CM1200mP2_29760 [Planctomycetaceae bacterium]